MNYNNGDDPNIHHEPSDLLPDEILKKLNDLLEQLHWAGHTKQDSKIEIVYVAPGGQHVDTIQTQIIASPPTPISKGQGATVPTEPPPPEMMVKAVEQTMEKGYWWASTAWAVVYRLYQMKGYTGSIKQFVREVEDWPWKKGPIYPCTYDGVQKPIVSGRLTRTIDKWKEDGAMEQMQKLGLALLDLLN